MIQQLYDVIEDVQKIFIRNQNDQGGYQREYGLDVDDRTPPSSSQPPSKRLKTGGGVKRKATTPLNMDLNELFKDVYTTREPEPIPSIPIYEHESFIPQMDDIYNEDRISEVDGQYIDILDEDTPIPLLTNQIINLIILIKQANRKTNGRILNDIDFHFKLINFLKYVTKIFINRKRKVKRKNLYKDHIIFKNIARYFRA